jgi:hypothetical protein
LTLQILEFSGIGNPEILANIGVKTKVDLPSVGENVQEHVFCALSWGKFSFSPFTSQTPSPLPELKEPEKYNTLDAVADETVLKEQLRL